MNWLHTPHGRAGRAALLLALAVMVPLAAAAGSFGPPENRVDCALDVRRSADPNAYYLEIGFGSAAAPDIALQVRGRLLRVQVRQATDGCRTRFYKSLTLPRDADSGHIQRQEEAGRVVFLIPRRELYWR